MALKIRTKIVLSFSIVTVLLSFLGYLAYHNRNVLFDTMVRVEEESTHLKVVSEVKLAMDMVVMPPNDYLITGDLKERERFDAAVRAVEDAFVLTEAVSMHDPRSERHHRAAVEKFGLLKEKAAAIFDIEDPIGNRDGATLMLEMDTVANDIIANHLDRIFAFEEDEISAEIAHAQKVRSSVNKWLAVGAAVSVATIVLLSLYLLKSIIRPIMSFTQGATIIRNGDLTHRINIKDGVEINALASEFNKMADKLWESHSTLEKKVETRTRELHEINERLKELSITDGLTGVFNQRHFYERLNAEIQRAERYGHSLALVMGDIDYFKRYNDSNGHLEGDRVLKDVAAIMLANVRGQDIVARYGGEEFSIIMPVTGRESALAAAERIRLAVREHPFPGETNQPGGELTISLGVAVYPGSAAEAKGLIKEADAALYRAKDKGRNRVEV